MTISVPLNQVNKFKMKTKFFSCLVLLILVIGIDGCSKSSGYMPTGTNNGGNNNNGGITGPAADEVWMQNTAFNPSTRTITAGTEVTWINKDPTTHDVTYLTGPVVFGPSGTLVQGSIFSFTFTTPGTYTYHCTIHAGMNGTIIVQ
jgi:plastocyanin